MSSYYSIHTGIHSHTPAHTQTQHWILLWSSYFHYLFTGMSGHWNFFLCIKKMKGFFFSDLISFHFIAPTLFSEGFCDLLRYCKTWPILKGFGRARWLFNWAFPPETCSSSAKTLQHVNKCSNHCPEFSYPVVGAVAPNVTRTFLTKLKVWRPEGSNLLKLRGSSQKKVG